MTAVKRETRGGKPTKKLHRLADKLVAIALKGDMAAMREIGLRLDGSPPQYSEISGPDGQPLMLVVETGVPTRAIEPPVDITPERNDINDLDDDAAS